MRKPDFFIVGAPKCGTTAMADYLKRHPEVFIPSKKAPHFFGTDLGAAWRCETEEEYLSLFSEARDEKRAGEGSVWYLYSERAAQEIKEFEPRASIIIMLRNPADMVYSLHSQQLWSGNEDIADFETALSAEEDRKSGLRIPKRATFVKGLLYREAAKYTEQIQRYVNVFGWENTRVIIFDDFKSDTAGVYEETLRFLGASPHFQTDFNIVNPNKQVRSRALRDFSYHTHRNPPRIARQLVRTLTSQQMRRGIARTLKRYNTQYVSRRPIDPELYKRLKVEFTGEVDQLSELLGRDLTHWSRT